MDITTVAVFFSALSFFFFGIACFVDGRMKSEYIRYGLSRQRPLVGTLQLMGGAGLIAGYWFLPALGLVSAVGLSLLMVLGFGVRLKIHDGFWQSFPSMAYAILTLYLAFRFYNEIIC